MSCKEHSWFGAGGCPRCVPVDPQAIRSDLNSRSEMRRLAVQNPDTLIAEIERLRAQVAGLKGTIELRAKEASNLCPECIRLRTELADLRRLYDVSVERGCDYEAQRNRLREALEDIRVHSTPPFVEVKWLAYANEVARAALEGK